MQSTIQFRFSRFQIHLVALSLSVSLSLSVPAASPAWLTAHDDKIKELVAEMTLAEKVGQMTQPDLNSVKDFDNIERLALGSILSGGSSDPKSGNSLANWSNLYRDCQERALKTRLGIPLIYGVDAVHGHSNLPDAVIFPHNIGLGCTRNPALVREIGRITAREIRATGIQWTFAPCLTVPRDIRWGRAYEGFSEDPEVVSLYSEAAVKGLQGDDLASPYSVVACAKHWVADGGTTYDSTRGESKLDQGNTQLSEEELRRLHITPYIPAIDAGVATIMPSYSSWNGIKLSGNKYLLTYVLKEQLGFEGMLISDYNAIDQLVWPEGGFQQVESNNAAGQVKTPNYKRCIEISINAGMDMVMVTDHYKKFITFLQELVQEGRVPMSRIDDAVTRILRVKFAAGMMEKGPQLWPNEELQKEFGSEKHRAVARQAVSESLVLLKNKDNLLPITNDCRHLHVAGSAASDVGMQCGGWTVSWQGGRGPTVNGGSTILQGLQNGVSPETKVTHSPNVNGSEGADLILVVVGEDPYAEMKGDRENITLSQSDQDLVANAHATGSKVALLIISGRPLVLDAARSQADAIVAAWLPGSEGAGVADVLLAKKPFTGKLSYAWPASMKEVPASTHEQSRLRYPVGYGLSYPEAKDPAQTSIKDE
ncbi:MAG: glycoside hydrolase family 3 protein [Roseibacillus sp.]